MKRTVLVAASALLALILLGGGIIWYSVGKPMYEPGMVRAKSNLRAPLAPPEQPAQRNFWSVEEGIRLYHYSEGEGRSVLTVHGGPGLPYLEPWPGLEPLTDRYQFFYYDQRGCGQSSRPVDKFSSSNYYQNTKELDQALGLGTQVADIERIRRILGEDRLIIIGHSFGGFLASLYAAEFPERVEALILIAPADLLVMPQRDGDLFEAVGQRLPRNLRDEYAAYIDDYLDFRGLFSNSEAELVAKNNEFAKYYAAATETSVPKQGEAGGWMVFGMYLSMGKRHDYRDALQAVTAPVLVIHGSEDLQPDGASRTYAEAFPNARFQVIPNAAHFPFHEQPAEFAAVTAEFLSGLKQ